MDHHLEDSLNLESAIGEMDFEHADDVVVSHADINLDTVTSDGDILMEFEQIEEQTLLMDPGNEEIIVSDFMSDQFSLQEYSVQDDQTTTTTTTEESNQQNVLTSQSDPLIDLQFDPQDVTTIRQGVQAQPKYISIKAAPVRATTTKKQEPSVSSAAPRQIAIAPKLPKLVPSTIKANYHVGKQFAIAPKPIAFVQTTKVKKLPLSSLIQGGAKGNTVPGIKHANFIKQIIGNQKLKLVTSGASGVPNIQYIRANPGQAQLITTKCVDGKPIMAKVIVQGQSTTDANEPTVLTKILPSTSAVTPQARYVMQQKTVPISLGNQVLLASPQKQTAKFRKKQHIIAIKSPTQKFMTAPAQGGTNLGTASKQVVITSSNPSQNVILKTTAPPKTAQMTKDGKVVVQGQRSQLHQINVPGKGIQYIRLITNQPPSTSKAVIKPQQTATVNVPSKSFVLTDNKGNLIQMSSEQTVGGQPPPLVYTGSTATGDQWQQKLVRIAPMASKATRLTVTSAPRSAQSLLAPRSVTSAAIKFEDSTTLSTVDEMMQQETELSEHSDSEYVVQEEVECEESDSKAALHQLVAEAVGTVRRVQHQGDKSPVEDENTNSMEHLVPIDNPEEQLIVIPSNFTKADGTPVNDYLEEAKRLNNISIEEEAEMNASSPPAASDTDVAPSELGLRPRRACNCAKSQCLKLYCDCFANGEFCNSCNCYNCYNNLNFEELRQKAIRACLERNPNAFRPKIGKTKSQGPEIIRRHNKGCNCKRSGCLKNYCECYEAKIACTAMCRCFGCRNVEELMHRGRRRDLPHPLYRPPPPIDLKQPCSFMTAEVIEAVCQCLIAASVDGDKAAVPAREADPVRDVIDEFSRCLQDIISACHHKPPLSMLDEGNT